MTLFAIMAPGDLQSWTDTLNTVGVLGVLLLALVGVIRGWWVSRREYDLLVKDRDEWKAQALDWRERSWRLQSVAHRVVETIENGRP